MEYRIIKRTDPNTKRCTYYAQRKFLGFFWECFGLRLCNSYYEANQVLQDYLNPPTLQPPTYEYLKPDLNYKPKPTELNLEQYCAPLVVGTFEDGSTLTGKLFCNEGNYFIETLGVNVWHHESYGPFTNTGFYKENYLGPNLVRVQRLPNPIETQNA